jgi:hypothetical protein
LTAAAAAVLVILKLVTKCDMEVGLSVLVLVATELVDDQDDSVDIEATIVPAAGSTSTTVWLGADDALEATPAIGISRTTSDFCTGEDSSSTKAASMEARASLLAAGKTDMDDEVNDNDLASSAVA